MMNHLLIATKQYAQKQQLKELQQNSSLSSVIGGNNFQTTVDKLLKDIADSEEC